MILLVYVTLFFRFGVLIMDTDILEDKCEGFMIKLRALSILSFQAEFRLQIFWTATLWRNRNNKRQIDGKIDGFEGTKKRTSSISIR